MWDMTENIYAFCLVANACLYDTCGKHPNHWSTVNCCNLFQNGLQKFEKNVISKHLM